MSQLLLHDVGNSSKLTWAKEAIGSSELRVCGFVLSPFSTLPDDIDQRRGAHQIAEALSGGLIPVGAEVYFDPTTHGAVAPDADKFDIYDRWGLWGNHRRGDLGPRSVRRAHVERALDVARGIPARPIAPTVPLELPYGPRADRAHEMAVMARERDDSDDVNLAVAGTDTFWTAGADLDQYVGELLYLTPRGVALTVVRPTGNYPWPATAEEIEGVCRTVHTFALRGIDAFVMNSDLAGLPAIAAGATRIGTSWNTGPRQFSYESFRQPDGPRRSTPRPTFRGLLASLRMSEARALTAQDPGAATKLLPGTISDGTHDNWWHHATQLSALITDIEAAGGPAERARRLQQLYRDALDHFPAVETAVRRGKGSRIDAGADRWVASRLQGLQKWMAAEGYDDEAQ